MTRTGALFVIIGAVFLSYIHLRCRIYLASLLGSGQTAADVTLPPKTASLVDEMMTRRRVLRATASTNPRPQLCQAPSPLAQPRIKNERATCVCMCACIGSGGCWFFLRVLLAFARLYREEANRFLEPPFAGGPHGRDVPLSGSACRLRVIYKLFFVSGDHT
jgi:hypothetical protein